MLKHYKLKFCLFADDANLLCSDKNLKSLETAVNEELINVQEWLTSNKLSLNIKKKILLSSILIKKN